jgi:hypothetical protein
MGLAGLAPPQRDRDIGENQGNFAPRQEQFAPANPQYVPDSFRFNSFWVKIDAHGERLG